jgi:hypothetical protein
MLNPRSKGIRKLFCSYPSTEFNDIICEWRLSYSRPMPKQATEFHRKWLVSQSSRVNKQARSDKLVPPLIS